MSSRSAALLFGLAFTTSLAAQSTFGPCVTDPNDLWNWLTPDPTCSICSRYDPPRDGDGKFTDVIERTTKNVKYLFDSGQLAPRVANVDWSERPHIKWLPFDFWVGNAVWRDFGGAYHVGWACASGYADVAYAQIVISYRRHERVADLVEWEMWNFWLARTGRTDWWDNWTSIVPDGVLPPSDIAPPPRRRAVAH